jgi:hypothetical protein
MESFKVGFQPSLWLTACGTRRSAAWKGMVTTTGLKNYRNYLKIKV